MAKLILDLCGGTGAWSLPYKEASYEVINVTLPENDVRNYEPPEDVYGILAAPTLAHILPNIELAIASDIITLIPLTKPNFCIACHMNSGSIPWSWLAIIIKGLPLSISLCPLLRSINL